MKINVHETAILGIDNQNDFFEGGALGVPNSNKLLVVMNKIILWAVVSAVKILFSCDWHKRGTPHQQEWGEHCIQDTPGAAFHKDLLIPRSAAIISKGMINAAYSALDNNDAEVKDLKPVEYLRKCGIKTLIVFGLATDYCVHDTVMDAIKNNFAVYLVTDAIGAVNKNTPQDGENAIAQMQVAGAILVTSDEVIKSIS